MSKISYRSGNFIVHEHKNADWKVRMGTPIEKHDDCIVAELINFTPETGAKYAVMYQFPDEKLLIEL